MSGNPSLDTKDKLMLAAIDLIAEKGYKGVSTMEIASAAGLSEKTLFRHFGSKRNLLEKAFDHFHYSGTMRTLFNEQLAGNLREDLFLIARTYHEVMNSNRKMIQIAIKEESQLPGFREKTQEHPRRLMTLLTDYLKRMAEKGKIVESNPELTAASFMMMHFGAFMNELDDEGNFPTVTLESFIAESVKIFARSLTP